MTLTLIVPDGSPRQKQAREHLAADLALFGYSAYSGYGAWTNPEGKAIREPHTRFEIGTSRRALKAIIRLFRAYQKSAGEQSLAYAINGKWIIE